MFASKRGTAAYLLFYGANAALLPILALHYQQSGVTGVRLGILTALWPAGSVIGAWIWGAVADGTGRHRLVLAVAIVGAAGLAQLVSLASAFSLLVPVVLLYAMVASPIGPMLDHGVLTDLGESSIRFGRVRLWGAVGWGIAAPATGILIDRLGLGVAFPVYGVGLLCLLFVSLRLPVGGDRLGADVAAGLRSIARSREWRGFLGVVLVSATGSTMIHHYLFVYLESIGGSGVLRGVALSVATVSELVVFGAAHRLLRRFDPARLILVAMGATVLRLLLYWMIRDPVLALIPQLLHGVSFSLRLVAGVAIAKRLAPPGMGTTAQAIFTATQMGAAGVAGALLGGILYRSLHAAAVFGWTGVALAVFLVFWLIRGSGWKSRTSSDGA